MRTVSIGLSHLILAYLILVEPLLGKHYYERLTRTIATDVLARTRFYRIIILIEWAWMVVVAAILAGRPDPVRAIGLTAGAMTPVGLGLTTGIFVGLAASTAVFAVNANLRAWFQKSAAGVSALIPVTTHERWLFAGVAVTAGICEEILFRGFLTLYFGEMGLSAALTIVLGAVIFGLAHAYQGWKGVAQTTLMGALFMALFVVSGSLVPCIVAHAAIDLRVLVLFRPESPDLTASSASQNEP